MEGGREGGREWREGGSGGRDEAEGGMKRVEGGRDSEGEMVKDSCF